MTACYGGPASSSRISVVIVVVVVVVVRAIPGECTPSSFSNKGNIHGLDTIYNESVQVEEYKYKEEAV